MARIYIAFGSNQDNPLAQLQQARKSLANHPDFTEIAASVIYCTPPWGYENQPEFLNTVASYDTTLAPQAVLDILQQIEQSQHRVRSIKNGPRTLDLDLLLYDELRQQTATLTLPHPQLHQRAFVLTPLADIAPNLMIAPYGRVAQLLEQVERRGIEPMYEADWQTLHRDIDFFRV